MNDETVRRDDLVRYFESGCKPRAQWRIGTEYEKVAVRARDGRALAFSGTGGVEHLLRLMAEQFGYEPVEEEGRILALAGKRAAITIEPGGQIELSGEQCETIHCAFKEFQEHARQLVEVGRPFDVALLGVGMQPASKLDQIELLPKARYRIMFPYMARKGRLGQRMMKQTAGVQANLDFSSEADAMRKLKLSMGLVPLLYAIFASSPISDGGLNGYHSFRGHIWLDTDPDRCGMPPFVFDPEASFERYVEYALDVPMYFLIRGHNYTDLTRPPGLTFRQYMEHGFGKERASMEDWANHLTTIFTEVRLKTYLEVRSADSQPPSLMLALPALMKGVLYNEDCSTAAWDLVKRWSYEERLRMNDEGHKLGLEARAGKTPFHQLANELIEIARVGLSRQKALNERGEDESIYLMRLAELVRSGHNQASLIIQNWKGRWNYEMRRLVEGCSYAAEGWL